MTTLLRIELLTCIFGSPGQRQRGSARTLAFSSLGHLPQRFTENTKITPFSAFIR